MRCLLIPSCWSSAKQEGLETDFNGDGSVDFKDFLGFTAHFGLSSDQPNFDSVYDLNRVGQIGFADFLILASDFGTS